MEIRERKFDVILLDVDGTLLDFGMSEKQGMKVVLEQYGFEPTEERLLLYHEINEGFWSAFERGEVTKEDLVRQRFETFFGRLGRAVDGREAEELYRRQLDASAFLIDGALELCAYLKDRYDLYVVTNGTSSTQYKRLAASGLDGFMKDIFVSEDAGSQKPQKEYFDYCFSRIPDANPRRMLLIGDSPASDIKGGMAAGTYTCWYNPGGKALPEGIRADYEVGSLKELMKKRLFSLALASVMALSLAGCGGSKEAATEAETKAETEQTAADTSAKAEDTTAQEETKAESEAASEAVSESAGGTLIVGFDQDFPPMGFMGDNGEYTGFDLELAKEVAERLGLEYTAQPIAWDSKDMELEAGNIDCIWNGFTMTGREDDYTWSEPYMANTQVFVVAKDSGIASQADLAGKIVECQVDSSAEAALKEVPDLTATFKQLLTTADYNSAFMDLEQGAVDAIAMDVIVAGYQIQQRNADFIILEDSLSAEEYGVGFKKGNTELRDKVQATLEEMAADGTLKSVSEKWFGEDVTTIGK